MKAFLPRMKDRSSGHIVNISSYTGLDALPGLSDYAASKAAIIRSVYRETWNTGVKNYEVIDAEWRGILFL